MKNKPISNIIRVELRMAPGVEQFIIYEKDGRIITFGPDVQEPHVVSVQSSVREAIMNTNTLRKELDASRAAMKEEKV